MQLRVAPALAEVSASDWDALVDTTAHPFLSHACLQWFEDSGAVGGDTGWYPAHRVVEADGKLLAAAPCYTKQHSYGEFVFDFAWANAAMSAGLSYYPKLVCAVPFAPVPGPRILGQNAAARQCIADNLRASCDAGDVSSAHRLFDTESADDGWLRRTDVRYDWHNRGYQSFDDFLAALNSKRRNQIRRERKRIRDQGLSCTVRDAESLSAAEWACVDTCYARTYAQRGQQAYLPAGYWRGLALRLPGIVKIVCVTHPQASTPEQPLLAAALMLRGRDTLFGRHWGTMIDLHSLHFETCYYQGIDYCIAHGLARYDAGVQGQHKLRRGFDPVISESQHYIAHPGLRQAVDRALQQERLAIADLLQQEEQRSAFRCGSSDQHG